MRRLIAAALLLLPLLPAQAVAEPDYRTLALAAADGAIIPGYQRFQQAAADLSRVATSTCAGPTEAGLEALRNGYLQAMRAWQGGQWVSFGPVDSFNRGSRVEFWPDKKNAGDRQMLLLLKERREDLLEPLRISFASVSVQGLPALETLLYGAEAPQMLSPEAADGAYRRRLALAIAGNLARIGDELVREWTKPDGFRAAIEAAGAPASPYTSHQQVAGQVFNAMHGQLQAIAEVKLGHPLGSAVEESRPARAESWRSKRSQDHIQTNLDSLKSLFAVAFVPILSAQGKEEAAHKVLAAFDAAMAALGRVPAPMEETMTRADGWKGLNAVKGRIKTIARLLEDEVGGALALRIGFNALDGD